MTATTSRRVPAAAVAGLALAALASCARGPSTESVLPGDSERPSAKLESPAFGEGGTIPKVHTCDGHDVSPPLRWSGVPDAARSIALTLEDPDAPGGTFTHWLIYNIPASVHELRDGVATTEGVEVAKGSAPARQGKNDFGKVGYGGPCPPRGTHRYVFRLFALDVSIDPGAGESKASLLRAMKGHVVAEGRLTGKYRRGG